jgi:fibronectin-binding autotransporter adhesin
MNRPKHGVRAAAVVAAAGLATEAVHGQNIWTGSAGTGEWYRNENWSYGEWPEPKDEVVIGPGVPGVSAPGAFCAKLTAQRPLSVGGGGTSVDQDATLTDFNTTGGFICNGAVIFSGNVNVQTSWTWRATNGFRNSGTMNVTALPLSQTNLYNEGTLKVENGPLTVANGCTLNNVGTLELRSGGHLQSGGTVSNFSTWRKLGSGQSDVACVLNLHNGSVSIDEGLMRWTGGGSYFAGSVAVEGGGKLRLEGPFSAPAHSFAGLPSITGFGELEIQCSGGASVKIDSDLTVAMQGDDGLHLQSGGITIPAGNRLTNKGKMRWDQGSLNGPGELFNDKGTIAIARGHSVPAQSGLVFRNTHDVILEGNLNLNTATFQNDNGGFVTLAGEVSAPTPSAGTLVNKGAMTARQFAESTAKIRARLVQNEGGSTSVMFGSLNLLGGGEFGPGGGSFRAEANTSITFDAGTFLITGTGHKLDGPGEIRLRGAGTVVSVQSTGGLILQTTGLRVLESNAQLGGPGTIHNHTNFVWSGQIGVNGQADFRNIGGGGFGGAVVIPAGSAPRLRGTFVNDTTGLAVLQQGSLDVATGTVDNSGIWIVNPTSTTPQSISGTNGLFQNKENGVISAEAPPEAGRSANITTTLDNAGRLQALGGITLTIAGPLLQLQNGVLSGGTYYTADDGRIILPGVPPITKLKNVNLRGTQQGMPWLAGVNEVEGTELTVEGDTVFTSPLRVKTVDFDRVSNFRIGPGGEVSVPGSTTVGNPESVLAYIEERSVFTLQPDPPRLITPVLIMHGGIRPGGQDAAGPFNLTGNLAMQPTGMLEIELGGPEPESEHDQMAITGSAALTGTLAIKLLPGFTPELGQSYTILTTTAPISGTFSGIQQPQGTVQFEAVYSINAVTLITVAGCYTNCDGSTGTPTLTPNDFQCFINAYASQSAYANCDGSTGTPAHTANDFQCFINAFAAGCGR